jgi:hypothetical protein
VVLHRIDQNKFVCVERLYRVVDGNSYFAVQYVNQLNFLVPMIRLWIFRCLISTRAGRLLLYRIRSNTLFTTPLLLPF